ncbi:MAG: acetyl-coenzyme A synthetase, partial [Thermoleophilaceae bacterium]|nr:acetyl-coenzyme A synthetase [Thermoleophilaceae bacterium]
MATDEKGADEHEGELQSLLNQERFDPPEDFVRHALVRDDSLHRDAERDPAAFWLEQARELDWFTDPSESLDDSNAPFFKWFADGKINASHNCLDRHVEAGNGDRVAFHWRGEEGEEEDWT